MESIVLKLGDDLSLWQRLVLDIKKERSTFDTSETEMSFGSVIIDYDHVQSKVNSKYDQIQRDILGKFASILGDSMKVKSDCNEFLDIKSVFALSRHSLRHSLKHVLVSKSLALRVNPQQML
jgi:hypothetical protein